MTPSPDPSGAQEAVFCSELHRHLRLLDAEASVAADELRVLLGRYGAARDPRLIEEAQRRLRGMAAERRSVVDMLAALGHPYPCTHA